MWFQSGGGEAIILATSFLNCNRGCVSTPLGASRYDVRIGGGRGSRKSRHRKGGCVNFIEYISSNCGQCGGGQKIQKILWILFMDAPLREEEDWGNFGDAKGRGAFQECPRGRRAIGQFRSLCISKAVTIPINQWVLLKKGQRHGPMSTLESSSSHLYLRI